MAPLIKQAPISCPGHTRPVVDISFSGETDCGPVFITAAKDCKSILRRGDTGDWIGTFLGHEGAVWAGSLDYHGTKAATGAADFTAKVWDTANGRQMLSITEDHIVRCLDMSKTDHGAHLLTANNAKIISAYDLIFPQKPIVRLEGHTDFIRRILWCNGDRQALTASEDATINLWDLKDWKKAPVLTVPLWSREMSHPLKDLQFHHPAIDQTGQVLVAMTYGPIVELYSFDWRNPSELVDGAPVATFTMPCTMHSVSLHPTDNTLVCGGEDHYLYRLDRESGDTLEICKGHFGPVHCVRFSPDGNVFSSGSEDGTVRLWQSKVGENYSLWQVTLPTTTLSTVDPSICDVTLPQSQVSPPLLHSA